MRLRWVGVFMAVMYWPGGHGKRGGTGSQRACVPGAREGMSCFPCVYSSNVPGEVMITLILCAGKLLSRRAGMCVVLKGRSRSRPHPACPRGCALSGVSHCCGGRPGVCLPSLRIPPPHTGSLPPAPLPPPGQPCTPQRSLEGCF